MPILVLTTTGRKSGKPRSIPVAFLEHEGGYAVLAANAGSDPVPAWWLNLQADPDGEIAIGGRRCRVRARRAKTREEGELSGEEAELWQRFASLNPAFGEYRNLTERRIPVVVLEPRR
jgi:F420H(2)-dependent quinone reductase